MNPSSIFISYRRDDCSGYAGRLEDTLEKIYGKGSVFRDVRDIDAGASFAEVINARLAAARAVLVLIGPRWVGPLADGTRRIDDPHDFVQIEVAAALAAHGKVIPVLLAGATLPATTELPVPLQALTQRQALTLSETSWEADMQRLIAALGLPVKSFKRYWIAAICAVLVIAGAITYQQQHAANQARLQAQAAEQIAEQFVGTWHGTVRYAWGDSYEESFEIKRFAGELTGTATFLKYPRGMQDVHVDASTLRFSTHSVETVNDKERELTHNYVAELQGKELRIRLLTTGGFTSEPPQEFVALRNE